MFDFRRYISRDYRILKSVVADTKEREESIKKDASEITEWIDSILDDEELTNKIGILELLCIRDAASSIWHNARMSELNCDKIDRWI